MKTLTAAACFLLSLAASGALVAGDLTLEITAPAKVVQHGEPVEIAAVLRNGSSRPVRLVMPGDGSESGLRTPVVKWQCNVQRAVVRGERADPLINSVGPEDVFELLPGEQRELASSLLLLTLTPPGTYRCRLQYRNDPEMQWRGIITPAKDSERSFALIRNTAKVKLVSNEIVLEVK
jgi:hypothetical protein